MKLIELERAKEIAYQKIGIDLSLENRPLILDDATLDFNWGYVFYYNGKMAIETNDSEYGYIGNLPILVDKLDGASQYVGGIGQIIDSQLEQYRVEKGYKHSIKFPINKDLTNLSKLDQAKAFFETAEIFQIKKGIEILESIQNFDIEIFSKIVSNSAFTEWSFEEMIASQFKSDSLCINNEIGNGFPSELEIFRDCTTLNLSCVEFDIIPDDLSKLNNLETIEFWYSKINVISQEIFNLGSLSYIEILDSEFGRNAEEVLNQLRKNENIEFNK